MVSGSFRETRIRAGIVSHAKVRAASTRTVTAHHNIAVALMRQNRRIEETHLIKRVGKIGYGVVCRDLKRRHFRIYFVQSNGSVIKF